MKKWQVAVWCVVLSLIENGADMPMALLPGKNILNIIPEFLGQSPTTTIPSTPMVTTLESTNIPALETGEVLTSEESVNASRDGQDAPDSRYPVLHAGIPQKMMVDPLPLLGGDHELVFNVSWVPSAGPAARDYSLEVVSETNTEDCRSPICYEYDIHGDSRWHLIPTLTNTVAETCSIKPGCAYRIRLIAHPWDGHSAINLHVQLDECVSGVCSCAHAPRLPAPTVQASTLSIQGEIYANVSWNLPPPRYPQRLPRGLQKHFYYVSIGKKMVSDAHPSPWYAHSVARQVDADGLVASGDQDRWLLLPITERGDRPESREGTTAIVLDVKLLARVNLVDERGCVGPAGNATAYDPAEATKTHFGTYILWATFGGVCVLAMAAVVAASARGVKRVLHALRPPPVSAPLEPLRHRPAWFPVQLTQVKELALQREKWRKLHRQEPSS